MNRKTLLHVFLALLFPAAVSAQGYIWGVAGGPSFSTQRVNGFDKDGFIRWHAMAFIESKGEYSPNALFARLGYHVKGSGVNSQRYFNPDTGQEFRNDNSTMEFGNLSLSMGAKQRKEVGASFVSYGLGFRLDYNLTSKFDPLFTGLKGTQKKFTYGLDVDVGFEHPLGELISTFVEIGFSPDLIEQIFIPPQNSGWEYPDGRPVIFPETSLTNVVLEARVGFRFWNKIIYTD